MMLVYLVPDKHAVSQLTAHFARVYFDEGVIYAHLKQGRVKDDVTNKQAGCTRCNSTVLLLKSEIYL